MKRTLLVSSLILSLVACQSPESQSDGESVQIEIDSANQISDSLILELIERNLQDMQEMLADIEAVDTLESYDNKYLIEGSSDTTRVSFPEFDLLFNGAFHVEEFPESDTLKMHEEVGEYIIGRALKLVLKDSSYSVKSYLNFRENIYQIYFPEPGDSVYPNWEEWRKRRQTWHAWTDFKFIPFDQKGEFILPSVARNSYAHPGEELKEALALEDTSFHIDGEMGGTSVYFKFLGRPAIYVIPYTLLKFELYDTEDNLVKERHLLIYFSYGC